jgi:hypothetical protein
MARTKKSGFELNMESTERQKKYVAEQEAKGGGLGLVFADAFLRGMRDIGYKNTAWALCEELDNAIQAGATFVAVRFGYAGNNKSQAKPDMLALIDNGVGMIPKMIGYAVRWGGTDREDDRKGFGRYGYGLPSSAVSFCKRYTVYSKTKGSDWHAVTVDIDKLAAVASDVEATNRLLQPQPAAPPAWVFAPSPNCDVAKFESGTVIVHEELDRLTWKTTTSLKPKLMQQFGINYRHWLPSPKLIVDDEIVEPVDPLFLMEHGRFFDATSVRAISIDTRVFEVTTQRGTTGRVKVRASYLPPNFHLVDPDGPIGKGAERLKGRFDIMKEYNGLLVCREGRQIDCIQPRWTKYQNYDQHVKIEIDFEPELDEFFGITTAKQQIVLDDLLWDKLESAGGGNLRNLVKDIRVQQGEDEDKLNAQFEQAASAEQPRPSEEAMMATEKFKSRPDKPSAEKQAKAQEELENTATKTAETTGKPRDQVMQELEEKAATRRFEVEFQAIPEGPFYRPKRLGEQKRLIINTLHPFYAKVYEASPEIKAALEVLLFVLAEAELEAEGEFESFYRAARTAWSERLQHALEHLRPDDVMRDKAAAVAEQMQMAATME